MVIPFNTPPDERQEDGDETHRIAVGEVDWDTLEPYFVPTDERKASLVWEVIGGKTWLVGIEITTQRFIGCPC